MTTAQQDIDKIEVPNTITLEAMTELASDGGESFATVEDLMKDLYDEDDKRLTVF